MQRMKIHDWISTSSKIGETHHALDSCINGLKDQLEGEKPSLITVFFGSQHINNGPKIASKLSYEFKDAVCSIFLIN